MLRRPLMAVFGDRIKFGSDPMPEPSAIEVVESASFLDAAQERDIFVNDPVSFLRLVPEDTAG